MKKNRFVSFFLSALFAFSFCVAGFTAFINSDSSKVSAYELDPSDCTHPALYVDVYEYPADCSNYAHEDHVCSLCGTVVSTKRTGSEYGNHIFDYEDVIDYGYKTTSCVSFCTSTTARVKCKVCGKTVSVEVKNSDYSSSVFHGLEQHMKLDTSVKSYDYETGLWTYHCDSCGKDVYCLIQSDRPYTTPESDDPDTPDTPDDPDDPVDPTTCVHNYVETSRINATCEQAGYIVSKCTICGNVKTETIPALGHAYGAYVVTSAATCQKEGTETCVCTRCGSTKTQSIPKTEHQYSPSPVTTFDATCQKQGASLYQCIYCGELKAELIPVNPENHTFTTPWTVLTEGTCNQRQTLVNYCSVCGKEVTKTGDYGEHDFRLVSSQKATCLSDGYNEYVCYYCGEHKTEVVKSTGHNFVLSSNDSNGNFTYTCPDCGLCIANTVSNNRVTRRISIGAFAITTTDPNLIYKDPNSIELNVTRITSEDDSYATHQSYLTSLNKGSGTNYSIQEAVQIHLLVDGAEYAINDTMTLSWYLDSELDGAKLAVIYYPTSNGVTSFQVMTGASIKKSVVTISGADYAKSLDGVLILGIDGSPVETSGDGSAQGKTDVKPSTGGSNTAVVVILIVLGTVLVLGGGVAAFFLLGKKKNNDFD